MTDTSFLNDRLDRLEMRLAHQDQTIEDLNQIITDQWKQIDILKRHVMRLDDQMNRAPEAALPPGQEPPPPHY